ncbi:GNAT family N-acetyltransferase [Porifericola rhodea]|uniref:GNAT family N-acetyltransferase n=1 Tax=Porifericola rhodea TaxID=930972 RepID=UPI002666A99C|nr:GNAT family N-acetyltransferase [Porifericola rhodea]WKN31311.1 GNAT family N-acetyltransferase [Porifericola rhodea]
MTDLSLVEVSTDIQRIDVEYVHQCLKQTPWAKDRSLEEMKSCIQHSRNYGIYYADEQVGYARLLTDYAFMAYILDVIVGEKHRGKGFARMLMEYILKDKALTNIKIWRLGTDDAHGLYQKVGFTAIAQPEKLMEIKVKN